MYSPLSRTAQQWRFVSLPLSLVSLYRSHPPTGSLQTQQAASLNRTQQLSNTRFDDLKIFPAKRLADQEAAKGGSNALRTGDEWLMFLSRPIMNLLRLFLKIFVVHSSNLDLILKDGSASLWCLIFHSCKQHSLDMQLFHCQSSVRKDVQTTLWKGNCAGTRCCSIRCWTQTFWGEAFDLRTVKRSF